jgi:inward rectifier potassium channel
LDPAVEGDELSRWSRAPQLHCADDAPDKPVTWLERLVDLAFAGLFLRVGEALAATPTGADALAVAGLLTAAWTAWATTTLHANRYDADDALHRVLVIAQLAGVVALALAVPDVLAGRPRDFALAYAVTKAILALHYLRAHRQEPVSRALSGRFATLFAIDTALWLVAAAVDPPWTWILWAAAVSLALSVPISRAYRAAAHAKPLDLDHLARRFGLLAIAVLGVGFVLALVRPLPTSSLDGSAPTLLDATLTLFVAAGAWWTYFGDVAGRRPPEASPGAFVVWVYAHLPLVGALTVVGAALTPALALEPGATVALGQRWLLAGGLAIAVVVVALLDRVVERAPDAPLPRLRTGLRLAAAALLVALVPLGAAVPAWGFLVLVGVVCLAQAVAAPLLAPLGAVSPQPRPVTAAPEPPTQVTTAPRPAATPARPTIGSAVRIGTPSELRRDLYFFMMQGSWTRFFAIFLGLYLALNVLFAGLYLLDPSSVSNLADGAFVDAFAFSVQTMSTIGYGAMSPISSYAHTLVTAEAAVGILFAALATGLVFAKASRPKAHVLFSEIVTVTPYHGVPTLMFRVGNTHGNEVVEATMRVSALVEERSPEGHALRRLHDLTLVRDNSPLFTMSWTVMHAIDAESCLVEHLDSAAGGQLIGLICVTMGFDATYAQTVHARHIYYFPEDFRLGERFVDVIETHADGHISIDFTRFHDTRPEGGAEP